MLLKIIGKVYSPLVMMFGILFAFGLTFAALYFLSDRLPKDHGRAFAHEGALSAGKPRGAGIIFILVFAASTLLFGHLSWETFCYLVFVIAAMLTGYFDDASKQDWGRLRKGLLDAVISVGVTFVYLINNGSDLLLPISGAVVHLPVVLFAVLSVALIWMSINVTNCSDGVDGLSATLALLTLATFRLLNLFTFRGGAFTGFFSLFAATLLAYLWFNATPSLLLMGDSGSRAMGLMLAICALTSGCPLFFLPAAIVLILDGGLGLVKLTLYQTIDKEKRFLRNVRLPLHDHFRKKLGWSNTQVVYRFALVQILCSAVFLYLVAA